MSKTETLIRQTKVSTFCNCCEQGGMHHIAIKLQNANTSASSQASCAPAQETPTMSRHAWYITKMDQHPAISRVAGFYAWTWCVLDLETQPPWLVVGGTAFPGAPSAPSFCLLMVLLETSLFLICQCQTPDIFFFLGDRLGQLESDVPTSRLPGLPQKSRTSIACTHTLYGSIWSAKGTFLAEMNCDEMLWQDRERRKMKRWRSIGPAKKRKQPRYERDKKESRKTMELFFPHMGVLLPVEGWAIAEFAGLSRGDVAQGVAGECRGKRVQN